MLPRSLPGHPFGGGVCAAAAACGAAHRPRSVLQCLVDERSPDRWADASLDRQAQRLSGIVRIDGKPFRYMGDGPRDVPALPQTGVTVSATHTIYRFTGEGVDLILTFFTPAFPQDLD